MIPDPVCVALRRTRGLPPSYYECSPSLEPSLEEGGGSRQAALHNGVSQVRSVGNGSAVAHAFTGAFCPRVGSPIVTPDGAERQSGAH
jgi:hypothetical protein